MYFIGDFRDKASIIIYYNDRPTQSSAYNSSQNAWPWMTLSGYFMLNSGTSVIYHPKLRLSKIIACKLIKIDPYYGVANLQQGLL